MTNDLNRANEIMAQISSTVLQMRKKASAASH